MTKSIVTGLLHATMGLSYAIVAGINTPSNTLGSGGITNLKIGIHLAPFLNKQNVIKSIMDAILLKWTSGHDHSFHINNNFVIVKKNLEDIVKLPPNLGQVHQLLGQKKSE